MKTWCLKVLNVIGRINFEPTCHYPWNFGLWISFILAFVSFVSIPFSCLFSGAGLNQVLFLVLVKSLFVL